MKQANSNLNPGDRITFKRGCLSYEGTILARGDLHGITTYRVEVNGPGGGAPVDEIDIHDGQVLRVYR